MNHLIIALLQFPIDIDIFDVEAGKVLEELIIHPCFRILLQNKQNSGILPPILARSFQTVHFQL
jgi:hypothetical protein